MTHKASLFAYIFACGFILAVVLAYPNWQNTGNGTISWDVTGYYAYLPSAFIYKDLTQLEWRKSIQEKYRPTGLQEVAFQPEGSQNLVMKYPLGMALAYTPWFLMANTFAIFTSHAADGFSIPYQFFLTFGCLFYAFVGLWFFRKILLRFFEDSVVAIVLLLIVLGTNYLNYTAFDMLMPHNYLFMLYAILVWHTILWYERPSVKSSIIIGSCIGLAALARPTEIVAAMIPILWGIYNLETLQSHFEIWKKNFVKILLAFAIVGLLGSLQLIYWKIISGEFIVYSYQDQGFSWNGVHLKNCFFSYRKGWLIYTPIMLFAIIGFVFLFIKNKKISPAVFLFFLINTYIIFSWDIWWYGGGFGQRAMIPSYVLLGLPLAAFVQFISKNIFSKIIIGSAFLFCVWLNIFQTWQAHPGGGFETEAMTKAYYWKIFGQTKVHPEWRILLDTDEEFLGEPKNLREIYFNDFEAETDSILFNQKNTASGNQSAYLSQSVQFTPKFSAPLPSSSRASWVRATADFYCEHKEWNYWQMTQLIISLEQDDTVVKEKMIRIHRVLGEKNWRRYSIVIKIPAEQNFNNVKVKLWNAGGSKELWMDNLKIEIFD